MHVLPLKFADGSFRARTAEVECCPKLRRNGHGNRTSIRALPSRNPDRAIREMNRISPR